jgi:cytochrome c biogenesis protein CcdA
VGDTTQATVDPVFPAIAELELLQRATLEKEGRVGRHAWQVSTLNMVLGIASTVLAAGAAINVVAEVFGQWVTGVSAGVAAVITGIQTAYRPDKAADTKAKERLEWELLATDVRYFLNVDFPATRTQSVEQRQRDARDALKRFEDRSRDLKRGKLPEQPSNTLAASPAPARTG